MASPRLKRKDFLSLDFDAGIKAAMAAHKPAHVHQAVRRSFKRSANSAVLGTQSAAMKAAFKPAGAYMITPALAKKKGEYRASYKFQKTAFGKFLSTVILRGKGIGLWNFPVRKGRMEKTPIGPSGKPGRRRVVRVQVSRNKAHKPPRRSPKQNRPKRWDHPYPEFGGFQMRGKKGSEKGAGKLLIWTRTRKPLGSRATDLEPVEPMQTLAPSKMIIGPRTIKAINQRFAERLPKEFVSNMNYYANIAAKRARR